MSLFMSSIFDLFLGKLIILTETLSYMDLENGDIMRTVGHDVMAFAAEIFWRIV